MSDGLHIAQELRSRREKAEAAWSERMRAFRVRSRPDFPIGYVRLDDPNSQGDPTELVVEVANSHSTRWYGYRYLKDSPADGILFTYESDVRHKFTNREVEIDLDIYWFDADGNMVGSTTVAAHEPTPISLDRAYRFVLEVPAGTVDIQDGRVLYSEYASN